MNTAVTPHTLFTYSVKGIHSDTFYYVRGMGKTLQEQEEDAMLRLRKVFYDGFEGVECTLSNGPNSKVFII